MVSLALLQALSYSCSNLPFTLGPFPLPVLLRVCSLPLAGRGGSSQIKFKEGKPQSARTQF